MNLVRVESSQLKEVGYDVKRQKLVIRFHNGDKLYRYDNVPKSTFSGLMDAESLGSYFNANIRTKFQYRPIAEHEIDA